MLRDAWPCAGRADQGVAGFSAGCRHARHPRRFWALCVLHSACAYPSWPPSARLRWIVSSRNERGIRRLSHACHASDDGVLALPETLIRGVSAASHRCSHLGGMCMFNAVRAGCRTPEADAYSFTMQQTIDTIDQGERENGMGITL
jgi:hypothetical protein